MSGVTYSNENFFHIQKRKRQKKGRSGVTRNNTRKQHLWPKLSYRKRELKEAGILNFCCENKPTYARLKKKEEINRPKKFTRFSNFAYSGDREIYTIK